MIMVILQIHKLPLINFGNAFVEIYETLKERYDDEPLIINDNMTEQQI